CFSNRAEEDSMVIHRKSLVGILVGTFVLGVSAAVAYASQTTSSRSSASADTLIIAIPGTPAGIDLDRFTGNPQTWTIATQLLAGGAGFRRIRYPYKAVAGIDNGKISGFTYPDLAHPEKAVPGGVTKCTLTRRGKTVTWSLRKGVKSAYGHELTS